MVRPDDGYKYYAYMLLYVDDALAIHHDATSALDELGRYFQMKPGSVGDPDIYLGAKLQKIQLENGVEAWSMSSSKYVQDVVKNAETYLKENYDGWTMPKRVSGPWPRDYTSEIDDSPELDPTKANYYQSQVGVLHWIVELGHVNIITQVLTLASHMALPREGHLEALFHMFAYLKKSHNARLVLALSSPDIDMSTFQQQDWKSFYGEVKEATLINMPEP